MFALYETPWLVIYVFSHLTLPATIFLNITFYSSNPQNINNCWTQAVYDWGGLVIKITVPGKLGGVKGIKVEKSY